MVTINYEKIILSMLKNQNGIIISSEITKANIPRIYLKIMSNKGKIIKISRGIYSFPEVWEDEMYILGYKYKKGIFSHGTALYIHKMSDRTPIKYEMNFPHGYHIHNNNSIF